MKTAKTELPAKSANRTGMFHRIQNAVRSAYAAINYRIHVATANLWRDQYNPLRGLTMQRAVTLLEEGERGAYADLQWTYRYVEMQDDVLGALIESRSSALEEMDWDIRVSDRAKTPEAKALADRQAARLKEVYEGIGNLQDAIEFLALASFRGFSHLEIVRNADGDIVELQPVEQWHWVRDGLSGQWEYNPESRIGTNRGDDVPLDRFIVREVERPINRVALIAFIRKSLSEKDWDAFVETYGIPPIFVIMPPELGEGQREEFQSIAEDVIGDSRGVLPGNSDVKTIDNGARGANPFRDHIRHQNEKVVLRGTGGKLTMLTESGSGTLAGSAHMAAFQRLAAAEAKKISELFRASIDAAVLAHDFPGDPVYAGFAIAENEETDTAAIVKDAVSLSGAGYKVEEAWLEEKTGYKLKTKDRPAEPGSKTQDARQEAGEPEAIRNRDGENDGEADLLAAAATLIEEARLADHANLVNGLRAALATGDEDLQERLQEWYDGLPESIGKTPAMEDAWEKVFSIAMESGLAPEREDGEEEILNAERGTPLGYFFAGGKRRPIFAASSGTPLSPKGQSVPLSISKQAGSILAALRDKDQGKAGAYSLGRINDDLAARILQATTEAGDPRDVRGFEVRVDTEFVTHAREYHGNMTEADFLAIPKVMRQAADIKPGHIKTNNLPSVNFQLTNEENRDVLLVSVQLNKQGQLRLHTYKKSAKDKKLK